MTVPSALVRANFTGDGTAGPKSFGFKIQDQNHLTVIVRDTTDATDGGTLLVRGETNGYTVAGVGAAAGGTITLTGTYATSVTSDFKGIILHTPTKTQSLDTRNSTTFNSSKAGLEDSLDKLTGMALNLQDQLDRALVFGAAIDDAAPDAIVNGDLPVPAAREFPIRNAANDGWDSLTLEAAGAVRLSGTPVDNALLKTDGTTGLTQPTGIIVDDSDNVSGIANLAITGNMTVDGTVDGRDVAADGTKLDYITVTQAVDLDTMESDIATNAADIATNAADIAAINVGTVSDLVVNGSISKTKGTFYNLTTDTNDAALTDFSTTSVYRLSSSSDVNITGLAGGSDGKEVTFINTGANVITFKHNSASSSAGNKFDLPSDSDVALGNGDSITLWFDDDTSPDYWRATALSQAASTGSGAVDSVNGATGTVVLDPDDLDDTSTTNKFVTASDVTNLSNLSGTNSGDESSATDSAEGIVELATIAEINTGTDTGRAITPAGLAGSTLASEVTANTAKTSNATHTGDVTGATTLTIADEAVTNAKLAHIATDTIKGRTTAGTGDVEDLTAAQVRTIINVEDGADVTDETSVTAAGALMDSEVTNLSQVKAFDTTDYATAAQGTTADSAMQDLVDDTTPQLGGALDGQGNDLNNLGVMFLTEQAAAEADVAGKGQIWVKTATPCELWFTDDAGTDSQLDNQGGGGGGIVIESATGTDNIGTESVGAFAAIQAGAEYNMAIGHDVLAALTTGDSNTGTGEGSLIHVTTGGYNTAAGRDSGITTTTGSYNTSLGYNSRPLFNSRSYTTQIGALSNASGDYGIAIGYGTSAASEAVALGRSSSAIANSFCFGSGTVPISKMLMGEGGNGSTSPQSEFTMGPSYATSTDTAGTTLVITGGRNTGAGTGGSIKFQIATVGASSSTAGTFADEITISENSIIFHNLPTSDPSVTGQLWNDSGTLKVSA